MAETKPQDHKPKTAKKPQDHKPKAEKPAVKETESGWEVTHRRIVLTIDKATLDDFELLDDLAELQRDPQRGAVRVPAMLRRLCGDDGFRRVSDGLRDKKTGRVPATTAVKFVFEVFKAISPNS